MTSTQRFLRIILPGDLFDALRSGTRNWLIVCPCGHMQDLWDAGGVKGAGNKEWTLKKCFACGHWRWHAKRKKTSEEFARFPKDPVPSSKEGARYYRPRLDAWAAVLVWGSATILWGSGLAVWLLSTDSAEGAIAVFLSIPGGFIAPWFLATTSYRLTATELHIQSGCFSKKLPYATIMKVSPKFGGIGISYAFSLDTLKIETAGSRLGYRIAPEDRAAFMSALAARCPHLKLQGGALYQDPAN